MVMRMSSPKSWRLSSAQRLAMVRLATGVCGAVRVHAADSTCVTVSVRECTADGSGVPPEWLARRPLHSGMSTSWRHYSTADDEVLGPGGLRRSAHAASSVPLGPAPGRVTATIAVECCRCTTALVESRAFVWRDCPALE
jgi:hypothetical protein